MSINIQRSYTKKMNKIRPWLFILPILFIQILVMIGPAISSIYYSLTDWTGIGNATFIGLENFKTMLFERNDFINAFLNNIKWLGLAIIPFVMALIAATLIAGIKKGGMIIRVLLFIPYVLPSIVTSDLWRKLLNPDFGLVALLNKIGIPGFNQAFLGNPKTALITIFFVDNWHWWVFLMVLFLAAMQNIPREQYEVARIEGANRMQEFIHVTLPGIAPTLIFMILMASIWTFQTFDYVWILTAGGPAGSSEILATLLLRNAFVRLEAGYASAIGLSITFFSGIFITIYILLKRKDSRL